MSRRPGAGDGRTRGDHAARPPARGRRRRTGARRAAGLLLLSALHAGPAASEAPANEAAPTAPPRSSLRPPTEAWRLHCAGCHRLDGAGVPDAVPDLRRLGPVLAAPGGREYLVRVPGVAQAPIDDAGLAELLGWVLASLAGVAPTPAFTAEEVGRLRSRPLRDPAAVRASLAIEQGDDGSNAARRPRPEAATDTDGLAVGS